MTEKVKLDPNSASVIESVDNPGRGVDWDPGDTLGLLRREMRRSPVLSIAEERDLARRIRDGDEAAKSTLVRHNLRLLVSVVKRYSGQGVPLPDLVQEGFFGLQRAAEKFDYTRGHKFSTYATIWIRQACLRALSTQRHAILVPHHVQVRRRTLQALAGQLSTKLGREPTRDELAQTASLSRAHVEEALAIPVASSLEVAREDGAFSWLADLPDDSASDAVEEAERERLRRAAREVLETLPPLERSVLEMRFGWSDDRELTLTEVGGRLGMPRERVRLIEQQALRRLEPRLAYLIGSLE